MNPNMHHCGSMMSAGNSQAELCEPLAQLKKEHGPLRVKMNEFDQLAALLQDDTVDQNPLLQLATLANKGTEFSAELELHSEREVQALFPMMANYIGKEVGPIAVMEYEHDQAKGHLQAFAEAMAKIDTSVADKAEVKDIASNALQAHAILTDHFMKEENVLFPMAEKMLSAEEKEQLRKKICSTCDEVLPE